MCSVDIRNGMPRGLPTDWRGKCPSSSASPRPTHKDAAGARNVKSEHPSIPDNPISK